MKYIRTKDNRIIDTTKYYIENSNLFKNGAYQMKIQKNRSHPNKKQVQYSSPTNLSKFCQPVPCM